MLTTIDELNEWIATSCEDCHLEFKEAKNTFASDKVMEYCVAIANEGGGKLILGITNSLPRRMVGTHAFGNIQDIQSKIFCTLKFRVDVEEIKHENVRVLIFHIPSRPHGVPLDYRGSFLMRVGEELHPMSWDRLRKIYDEGKPDWFSEIALSKVKQEDLVNLLDVNAYFWLTQQPLPSLQGILERFQQEGLIVRVIDYFSITNLGAILFAKKLQDFRDLERKAVRVIVYEGKDKTDKTRVDISGTHGYATGFEGLIRYISSFLPKNEVIGKALRETVQMYPDIAIRELVANALIHQDFTETGTSVLIEVYIDRIEISNPGVPFIPIERFIDEFQSRNERLAALMRRMRICEEKGSGIDKVINSVEVFQLPAPDFRAGERRTLVVLFAHKDLEEMDNSDRIRACYQHCALKYVMEERMTNQSLRERFKLPESKADLISRIIHDAVESGLVKPANPENTSRRYSQYIPFWA
jgi:ATP-dependent DNA helicase RecG